MVGYFIQVYLCISGICVKVRPTTWPGGPGCGLWYWGKCLLYGQGKDQIFQYSNTSYMGQPMKLFLKQNIHSEIRSHYNVVD